LNNTASYLPLTFFKFGLAFFAFVLAFRVEDANIALAFSIGMPCCAAIFFGYRLKTGMLFAFCHSFYHLSSCLRVQATSSLCFHGSIRPHQLLGPLNSCDWH